MTEKVDLSKYTEEYVKNLSTEDLYKMLWNIDKCTYILLEKCEKESDINTQIKLKVLYEKLENLVNEVSMLITEKLEAEKKKKGESANE